MNWKERNRQLRFPTPENITIAEGLGWVEASLIFFEEALASQSLGQLLACGRVAYALHNLPEVLVQKLRGKAPVLAVFGPDVAMGGPAEVNRYCGIFFSRPRGLLMPALYLTPEDPVFVALSYLYLALRLWNQCAPDTPLSRAEERLTRFDWQQERKQSLQNVRALLEHFEFWIEGQPFEIEDFKAAGGYWPDLHTLESQ